jgi:hypothetical protein
MAAASARRAASSMRSCDCSSETMPEERKHTAIVSFPFDFTCKGTPRGVARSLVVVRPKEIRKYWIVAQLRPEALGLLSGTR